MNYFEAKTNDFLFKQGDDATSFFILGIFIILSNIYFKKIYLDKGTCEVIINEQSRRILNQGECFGDLALLYNAPRSASIKATENCFLWGIDRNTFRNAMEEINNRNYAINRAFIEDIKFFRRNL